MSNVRRVHFNRLPSTVRERFVRFATRGEGSTLLLSSGSSAPAAVIGWGLLAAIALGGLAFLALIDYGSVSSPVQDAPMAIGYGIALLFLGGSVGSLVRRLMLVKRLPFRPGDYLFPMMAVKAPSSRITVMPLTELRDFKCTHHHTNGVYTSTVFHFDFQGGEKIDFSMSGKPAAESLLQNLGAYSKLWGEACEAQDALRLVAMDPFLEARLSPDWESATADPPDFPEGEPLATDVPPVLERRWLVALAFGVLCAYPVLHSRNKLSDSAAFEAATLFPDPGALRRYAQATPWHREEVLAESLPRAEFETAARSGSVERLRSVAAQFPEHEVAGKARERIHALFAAALEAFRATAKADAATLGFMEHLLAWLESHQATDVEIRFRSPSTEALTEIDRLLVGEAEAAGVARIEPVAEHFTDAACQGREGAIVQNLQSGFGKIFSQDVLRLLPGSALESGEDLGTLRVPTLAVSYRVEGSGSTYYSENRLEAFVGIVVTFQVAFRLPGEEEGIDFEISVEPPERFEVEYHSPYGIPGLALGGPSASSVYSVMASRAFDQLAMKLESVFLGGAPPREGE